MERQLGRVDHTREVHIEGLQHGRLQVVRLRVVDVFEEGPIFVDASIRQDNVY